MLQQQLLLLLLLLLLWLSLFSLLLLLLLLLRLLLLLLLLLLWLCNTAPATLRPNCVPWIRDCCVVGRFETMYTVGRSEIRRTAVQVDFGETSTASHHTGTSSVSCYGVSQCQPWNLQP